MTFCDFVFALSFICLHLIISESGVLDHWGKFWAVSSDVSGHSTYEWNGGKPATFLLIPDPMLMAWRQHWRTGRLITVATLPDAQSPYWNCAWRASGLQSLISGWNWGRSRLIRSSSSAWKERHFRPHRKNCWERAGVAAKVNSPLKPRTDAQRFSPLLPVLSCLSASGRRRAPRGVGSAHLNPAAAPRLWMCC